MYLRSHYYEHFIITYLKNRPCWLQNPRGKACVLFTPFPQFSVQYFAYKGHSIKIEFMKNLMDKDQVLFAFSDLSQFLLLS